MTYTLEELSRKDVINVENGCRIGCIRDIEIGENGEAAAVKVERAGANPFKKPETFRIGWSDIVVIGKETVLVRSAEPQPADSPKKGRLSDIFP